MLGLLIILFGLGIFGLVPKKITTAPISSAPAKYQDFHLEIPKLELSAPIIPEVPGGDTDKDIYFKSLENGVAHFAGTKKPGENGLIFIFGHSSYYPWAAGDYKEIFANLDDLAIDDEISVWYQEKEYKYLVIETKTIVPSDVSVLNPTNSEELVLMTCWPPGTTTKRLIIRAKPI